jgi:hypothetical protein
MHSGTGGFEEVELSKKIKKAKVEQKEPGKPTDSKRGIRQRQAMEVSHPLHSPPVYGCALCAPAIAARERAAISSHAAPVGARVPKANAEGITNGGVHYRYHRRERKEDHIEPD